MQNVIKDLERLYRKYDLDYDGIQYANRCARKNMNIKPPKRAKKLPVLLSEDELRSFMARVMDQADLSKMLIYDLMLYSGLRVSEVLNIKVEDVYPKEGKILIRQAKGSKDRYILYPDSVRFKMEMILKTAKEYLFRNPQTNNPITARTVENWCKSLAKQAGITKNVHPHLFRHHFATNAKTHGMSDETVALLMGHSNVQSTKTYTHLTLETIRGEYNKALRG